MSRFPEPAARLARVSAAVYGCAGPTLGSEERRFFAAANPLGFILFARNLEEPRQARALVAALREAVGRPDAPVLIDQEGGRVARLKPPHWRAAPAAERFGRLAARNRSTAVEAARLNARLIAAELTDLGITVDCAPVLDLRYPGAHEAIGDRAFANDPELVAVLGRAVAEGLMEGGVIPVIKHIPGHGRATVDSHRELPRVTAPLAQLERTDFAPFRALNDMPWAMTAHIVYRSVDAERPATTSARVIGDVIRGRIGFSGLLLSDDIAMDALSGGPAERARAALAAGCDVVLHCNGKLEEMAAVAAAASPLSTAAMARVEAGAARVGRAKPAETAPLARRLDSLLAV